MGGDAVSDNVFNMNEISWTAMCAPWSTWDVAYGDMQNISFET